MMFKWKLFCNIGLPLFSVILKFWLLSQFITQNCMSWQEGSYSSSIHPFIQCPTDNKDCPNILAQDKGFEQKSMAKLVSSHSPNVHMCMCVMIVGHMNIYITNCAEA